MLFISSISLIPISKVKSLLLVGDPQQLKPITSIDEKINKDLKKEYCVDDKYDFKKKSILEVMTSNDNISKKILLKYHYRCGRLIINYSNQRYYNNELDLSNIKNDGILKLLDINNKNSKNKNEEIDEALAIVDYIKRNNLKNAFIITPFKNQSDLLNKLIKDNNIEGINCGTIHSMQGSEKDTVILSTAISLRTSKKTFD